MSIIELTVRERERERGKPSQIVTMMEQDACEFTCGIEVGPIDGGAHVRRRGLDECVEGRVERCQKSKVRWAF